MQVVAWHTSGLENQAAASTTESTCAVTHIQGQGGNNPRTRIVYPLQVDGAKCI